MAPSILLTTQTSYVPLLLPTTKGDTTLIMARITIQATNECVAAVLFFIARDSTARRLEPKWNHDR